MNLLKKRGRSLEVYSIPKVVSRSKSAAVQVADGVSRNLWVGARAPMLVQKAVDLREAEP